MRRFFLFAFVFFCAALLGSTSVGYKPLRSYKLSLPQHAKPLIIIDPGHGGTDEGAKIHYFMEKN